MPTPEKSPRSTARGLATRPRLTSSGAGRPTAIGAVSAAGSSAAKPEVSAGNNARVGKVPDVKAIGAGPVRLSTKVKLQKANDLQVSVGAGRNVKLKELQKQYWVDPRTPYIAGRASLRVVDGTWFYTDEPSIGLSPYGGNTGGADLRVFFKPVLKNRQHLISVALTALGSKARVTLSALGVQQTTTLQAGAHWLSMLVTPTTSDTFTILLGVDGATASERIAVHGCDISMLG